MKMHSYLILYLFLIFTSCDEGEPAPVGLKKIEKEVRKISEAGNIPSLEVTVQTGAEVLTFSYNNEQTSPQSVYGIGSTTKLPAAVLVAKKVENGELNPEDPITAYIDPSEIAFIEGIESVTVKSLLNHTSGIADYTKHGEWGTAVVSGTAPKTFEEKIKYINPALKQAGSYNYSNSNYLFLERIIESIDGNSYDRSFNDFYAGLGVAISLGATPMGLEAFYAQTENSSANVSHWEERYGFDGGAYADSKALNDFLKKLFLEKTILSASSLETLEDWVSMGSMTIPIGSGSFNEYGNGLMKLSYKGRTYIGHSGGTLKYQSFAFFNPETNVTISILTNCSGRHYNNVFFQEIVPAVLDEL